MRKYFPILCLAALSLAATAQAAVIIESSDGAAGGLTVSGFETTADTDLLLVGVGFMRKGDGTGPFLSEPVTDLTFNGTSLTPLTGSKAVDDSMVTEFFVLANPGVVTGDIVVSTDGTVWGESVAAYALDGDNIQISIALNTLDQNVSQMSTDISTSAGALLIDMISTDDADGHTAWAGQTVVVDKDGDKSQSSTYKTAVDGTNTMGYDFAATNDGEGAHTVLAIVPEPATMSLLALGGLAAVIRRRR